MNATRYFPTQALFFIWLSLFTLVFSSSLILRLWDLNNPLVEPHPIRQSQTALTAVLMAENRTDFLNYRSPYEGRLWSFVHEFPLYQWVTSRVMQLGFTVEIASRLVTLFSFFMGLYFFLLLTRRFLERQVVPWALLVYTASPFWIIYSRTCLVDVTALALLLASIESAFRAADHKKTPSFYLYLAIAFITGSLAATTKTNLWFIPIASFFIYVLFQYKEKRYDRKVTAWLLGQAMAQLVCTILWIRYTVSLRHETGVFLGQDTLNWIIGPFALRFSLEPWLKIFYFWFRSLWGDWMLLPALFAFFSPYRKTAILFLLLSLLSISITFNVHSYHDYYLIGESPFLLALPAIGLWYATRFTKLGTVVLAMTVCVFLVRIPKMKYFYAPIFNDYRNEVAEFIKLRKLTSQEDLVFYEARTEQWEVPLYTHRDVILSPYFKEELNLTPSVYVVKDPAKMAAFKKVPQAWVEATQEGLYVLRTNGRSVASSMEESIRVSTAMDSIVSKKIEVPISYQNTCQHTQNLNLSKYNGSRAIEVKAGHITLMLPFKPYLSLPKKNQWGGCNYIVSVIR